MRKHELEITELRTIETILQQGQMLHLALCEENNPYCLTVCYGFIPGKLYLHSAPEGKKIDILRRNPRVSFQVVTDVTIAEAETSCAWSVRYRSVAGSGTARFLREIAEKAKALDILMGHYSMKHFHHQPEVLERTAVIEIIIEDLVGKYHPLEG